MPGTEVFGAEEKKEVMDVLETGVLFRYNHDQQRNNIWKAKTFEKEFADYHKVKHCHMCSSGTTADYITLAMCGVGLHDEVIIAPFTYIAPVEAILNMGAVPVFAEVDETLCLTAQSVKNAITPRTKAVMLVHMTGAMADIEGIKTVCQQAGVKLIEDTAQALGASFKGQLLGSFGDAACYSFDFFKIITAGEGGAVITNSDELYDYAHQYSDHGHDHIGNNRGAEQHPILGTNFRISELHAAVGLAQFRKLPYILSQQRKNKKVIWDFLKQATNKITYRHLPDPEGDSATFLDIFLPTEDQARAFAAACGKHGVGAAYWYDNNYHYFRNWHHIKQLKSIVKLGIEETEMAKIYETMQFPQSDKIIGRLVSIQIKVAWTDADLEQLKNKLQQIVNEVAK